MMSLAPSPTFPCTIRPFIVLAPSLMLIFLALPAFVSLWRLLTRRTLWIQIKLNLLLRMHRAWRRWRRVNYTICTNVSLSINNMGRHGPRPTTCRTKDVLIARGRRNWSTHMVIRTTPRLIHIWIRLVVLRSIWVAVVDIIL